MSGVAVGCGGVGERRRKIGPARLIGSGFGDGYGGIIEVDQFPYENRWLGRLTARHLRLYCDRAFLSSALPTDGDLCRLHTPRARAALTVSMGYRTARTFAAT